MDFKSLMSAQIAKSRPPPSKSASTPSASPPPANSKYLRRADLEAARAEAYAAGQAKAEAEREERAAKRRRLEDEEAERDAIREEKKRRLAEESKKRREEEEAEELRKRRKRLGLPDVPEGTVAETNGDAAHVGEGQDMPDDELRSKLRDRGEPAAVFDETHAARLKRYYTITAKSLTSKPKLTDGPIPTSLEPVAEKEMLLPASVPAKATAEHDFLHRQLASYFTLVLTEWAVALDERDGATKASSTGKAAEAAFRLVLKDLTPLFRHFERQSLPPDLLTPIVQIARSAQNRRYVEANDGYLTLSIGKAAWPIGVTMVGIHERSAREKLHETSEGKQAHIMTDEVTRKFLQSIKRCLTFAQTRWPPHDLGQLMG